MNITPASIAVCNQKGGVGKSTFTVLLASYLHHILGHDVLVVDYGYREGHCKAVTSEAQNTAYSDGRILR